jgi:hypothetical protein
MPIAPAVKAWAQIELQELGDGHAEVGIAVRIDREPLKTRERLAYVLDLLLSASSIRATCVSSCSRCRSKASRFFQQRFRKIFPYFALQQRLASTIALR